MKIRPITNSFYSWLPLYVNGSLSPVKRWVLNRWLARSEAARQQLEALQALQTAAKEGELATPGPGTYAKIRSRILTTPQASPLPQASRRMVWIWGTGLTLMAFFLLWFLLPPGIVLEWSVQGQAPQAFRVYRAPIADSGGAMEFALLEQIPAQPTAEAYRFTDSLLLPGQSYVYRVETLDQSGELVTSSQVMGDALETLPGQIAILLSAVIAGYGIALLLSQTGRQNRIWEMGLLPG